MEKMLPWYKGFRGKIYESVDNKGNSSFISSGIIKIDEEREIVEISELPVHEFTRDYKTFLEKGYFGYFISRKCRNASFMASSFSSVTCGILWFSLPL